MIAQTKSTKQPGTITEQIFNDLLAEHDEVMAENREWREKYAELEEENKQLHELLKNSESQRVRQYQNYANLFDWLMKLISNSTIPAGCKITYIFIYITFYFMRHTIVDDEMHVPLIEIEAGTGQSTSVISDHLKRATTHGLLDRRDEKITTKKGETNTLVHLTLHKPILEPELINLEKEQGGKRKKGCKKDGTPLDNYTVRHCPTHGEISIYGQPGLRKEADVTIFIDDFIRQYENRVPHALETRRQEEKQDAFDAQHSQEVRINSQISETPVSTSKKQDAFTQEEKQDALETDDQAHHILPTAEELAAQHTNIKSAASCQIKPRVVVCKALIVLNKNGEQSKGLEKEVSRRECGSTRWHWSKVNQRAECVDCYTPMPVQW